MVSWLKDAVFYQIYPASFFDYNGDGVGDLRGIEEKIPYIKSLGVDAVWLNPVHPSPFLDGGYDVTDYYGINPMLGTPGDFDSLIKAFKKSGIKVIMDMVLGHTSINHPWFIQSSEEKKNAYSDYYVWSDTNFDEYGGKLIKGMSKREGGYLINYYASQPALNYGFNKKEAPWQMPYSDSRLKPLREKMLDILRFWLKKGVDGFRFDMASSLVKGCSYNSSEDEGIEGDIYLWNEILGILRREFKDKAYIAEWIWPQNSVGKCGFDLDFLSHDTPEFNALYRNEKNTNLLRDLEKGYNYFSPLGKGDFEAFKKYAESLYGAIEGKGYFTMPSGTHDEIRMASFKSPEIIRDIFVFLLTFKHVPFIYYGDEIGMPHTFGIAKDGGSVRTGCRTPMCWDGGKNAGFSKNDDTYLPVNKEFKSSVKEQENKEDSVLETVKKLIKIRKENSCLNADGGLRFISASYPLVYERYDGSGSLFVAINPKDGNADVDIKAKKMIFSSEAEVNGGKISLGSRGFAVFSGE